MSTAFVDAAASYFGMDPTKVHEGGLSVTTKGLTVSLRIVLTDEDIIGVAGRMQALARPAALPQSSWSMPPTPELQKAKAKYLDEGVAGRAVAHVDAPVEPEPSGLPAAVWVPADMVPELQRMLASEYSPSKDAYLLQTSMLTSVQAQKAVDHDWQRG